mmetsp:Transcript_35360/g.92488  ORF Transcript_35360/g.92488 Transcript_35360/m.92488 type:complete len:395 (+) Transcript_35360:125-1309(+)
MRCSMATIALGTLVVVGAQSTAAPHAAAQLRARPPRHHNRVDRPPSDSVAFFLAEHAVAGLWSARDTIGFSGTEGSMLAVAHGVAKLLPSARIYIVHKRWHGTSKDDGVTYCNLATLPPIHTAIFGNDKGYPARGGAWSVQGIVDSKKVRRVVYWRENTWPHYDNVPSIDVAIGPELVFNSWYEYYTFRQTHQWPNDKVTAVVIPNPVMARPRNATAVVDPNKLLYASAFRKGLRHAYAAFAAIHAAIPTMRLKLFTPSYGKGQNPRDFDAYPLPESARANLDIVGSVGKAELLDEVETSLAVLYPTLYRETFGNSMAEAQALGTPVIHVETGSLPEVLYNPLAQSVRWSTMANDSVQLVKQYRNGGRPEVRLHGRFQPEAVAQQWVDFLHFER